MWMQEFLIPMITGSVGVFAGSFSGWFFSRKKETAEITGTEIDNAKELVDMYRTLTNEIKVEFDKAKDLIRNQQETIQHFKTQCVQINKCQISQ